MRPQSNMLLRISFILAYEDLGWRSSLGVARARVNAPVPRQAPSIGRNPATKIRALWARLTFLPQGHTLCTVDEHKALKVDMACYYSAF